MAVAGVSLCWSPGLDDVVSVNLSRPDMYIFHLQWHFGTFLSSRRVVYGVREGESEDVKEKERGNG